jgi:ribosomal protein S24E
MKWIILSGLLVFAKSIKAEVSHTHVSQMLDQMVRENVISQVEADKARARMKSMSPEQWGQINSKAAAIAARSPASANEVSNNKIEEVHKIDLDGAQFKQIQEDMGKIVPRYQD